MTDEMKNKVDVIPIDDETLKKNEANPFYMSHSKINMLLRCPRSFEFRYVYGLKIPPAGALVQGSSYHKGLEVGYKYKMEHNEMPPEKSVLEAADQGWIDRLSEWTEISWEGKDKGKLKDEVMGTLSFYVQNVMPQINPIMIEQKEEIKVGDIPCVRVRDVVTNEGVIDHKLAADPYSILDKPKDIQSLAYLYPDGGRFWYHVGVKGRTSNSQVLKGKPHKFVVQVIDFSRTKSEVDWWVDLLNKCYAQIKAGIFPANPSNWLCSEKWCGYYQRCHASG